VQPLLVTPGEPAGIGPECLLRFHRKRPDAPLVAVADPDLLRQAANDLSIPLDVVTWKPGEPLPARGLACRPVTLAAPNRPGRLDPRNAPYVLDTLRVAVDLVRGGHASALVTGPIHKGVINESGEPFSGHTEFLRDLTGAPRVVMMLAAGSLRVALVTTHLPLAEVPAAVTGERVESTLRVLVRALREQFHVAHPRVQVLGLNPHAGEGGHLGREDDDIIAPAIEAARDDTATLVGPVPADTAFTPRALAHCDAVLAMYHDQGLPVLKHAGFGRAVNITLGLPFVRTSVDHGTALDIAGKGLADDSSIGYAIDQALAMVGE
jgi:4-hydroxythreonine-4-phosphate dehydrogenase